MWRQYKIAVGSSAFVYRKVCKHSKKSLHPFLRLLFHSCLSYVMQLLPSRGKLWNVDFQRHAWKIQSGVNSPVKLDSATVLCCHDCCSVFVSSPDNACSWENLVGGISKPKGLLLTGKLQYGARSRGVLLTTAVVFLVSLYRSPASLA